MPKTVLLFKISIYTLMSACALVLLYAGSYYVIYCANGQWMTNKYNRYYFDGEKNYFSTGWRISKFWDTNYEIMEYVEPLFAPCLYLDEKMHATPCNAEQNTEARKWRAMFPSSMQDTESGFVFNSYGHIHMHTLTFWGQSRKVHSAQPTYIW